MFVLLYTVHTKVVGNNCVEYTASYPGFAQFVPKEYQGGEAEPCSMLGYGTKMLRMSVYQKTANPFATPQPSPAPAIVLK